MAHQFTDEVFTVVHEPPHGPQFHQACFLLRPRNRPVPKIK
jgi:hypothetical protein